MEKFSIRDYRNIDKRIFIDGLMDIILEIDYDDVDHQTVDSETKNLVDILNEHWKPIEKPEWIQCSTCDEQFRHFKKFGYTQCNDCIIGDKKL
jgi:protein-arginine kinase activator protein McsA